MFNHDYPDKETDTTSARFLRSQLEAMGLDTILQYTESLEQSYTSPIFYKSPTRDRSASDNTDFVFIIPVERQSANAFFFDGLNSETNTENITLSGKFITDKDNNKLDTYAILNRNDVTSITTASYNRTPPIVCLVSDTFGYSRARMGELLNITQERPGMIYSQRDTPRSTQGLWMPTLRSIFKRIIE
jgi:hypothetical protein